MSAGIKVTPEQLQSYSGTVKQRAGDVEGISTGLSKQLEALVGADWAGAASGQFGQLWQQWHKGAKANHCDGPRTACRGPSQCRPLRVRFPGSGAHHSRRPHQPRCAVWSLLHRTVLLSGAGHPVLLPGWVAGGRGTGPAGRTGRRRSGLAHTSTWAPIVLATRQMVGCLMSD
ncbi:MAG: WXG100 family type VII secretion target [Actinobacteria bacterium]|nr:WXG100 family type VII secretion target [Actinomycetota bacterium]